MFLETKTGQCWIFFFFSLPICLIKVQLHIIIVLCPVESKVAVVELGNVHTQSEMWGLIFSCELFLVMISLYAMKVIK